MKKILFLISISLISCGEPVRVTKCKSLLNKKVLVGSDTLVIINYNYHAYPMIGFNDELILNNGIRLDYSDIDKFLIK